MQLSENFRIISYLIMEYSEESPCNSGYQHITFNFTLESHYPSSLFARTILIQ
jgi:hypothetical protein